MRRMEASFKKARALRLRFPSLWQGGGAAAAVEPGNRALDDPTLGQPHEPSGFIGSFDDFGSEAGQDFRERIAEYRPLSAVGEQLLEERKLTERRRQQQDAAIAILDAGGMDDGVQQ